MRLHVVVATACWAALCGFLPPSLVSAVPTYELAFDCCVRQASLANTKDTPTSCTEQKLCQLYFTEGKGYPIWKKDGSLDEKATAANPIKTVSLKDAQADWKAVSATMNRPLTAKEKKDQFIDMHVIGESMNDPTFNDKFRKEIWASPVFAHVKHISSSNEKFAAAFTADNLMLNKKILEAKNAIDAYPKMQATCPKADWTKYFINKNGKPKSNKEVAQEYSSSLASETKQLASQEALLKKLVQQFGGGEQKQQTQYIAMKTGGNLGVAPPVLPQARVGTVLLQQQTHSQAEKASKVAQRLKHALSSSDSSELETLSESESESPFRVGSGWANAHVYYQFIARGVGATARNDQTMRQRFAAAIRNYEENTCLFFEEWTLASGVPTTDSIHLKAMGPNDGSHSVGPVGFHGAPSNQMYIQLSSSMLTVSTASHELGHALGLKHTNQRSDAHAAGNVMYHPAACVAEFYTGDNAAANCPAVKLNSASYTAVCTAGTFTQVNTAATARGWGLNLPVPAPDRVLTAPEILDCRKRCCAWDWQYQYTPLFTAPTYNDRPAAPYDHGSIMHYPFDGCLTDERPWYVRFNPFSPSPNPSLPSAHDHAGLRTAYGCHATTITIRYRRHAACRVWIHPSWTVAKIKRACAKRWNIDPDLILERAAQVGPPVVAAITLQLRALAIANPVAAQVSFPDNTLVTAAVGGVTIGVGPRGLDLTIQ